MDPATERLPDTYLQFVARFPELAAAHTAATEAVLAGGPLDARSCELIKIGICLGGGLESALKSHVRGARRAGASVEEIEQAISLGMTTTGWARTVAAWRWMQDQIERDAKA